MNPQQIQAFLNSKVPVCNTNYNWSGWVNGVWSAPPYTCLKDFSENGKSSAQIIWEASQNHGINPQVLIATLQKETALVTDTWAAPWQYQRAMGYACPDTAACNSQYYGFTNQVNTAAWQLKRYTLYPDNYNFKAGVTRNVRFHPNISCGSSPVYIETKGTAALYNYTPYQPNSAALNNMYGTGDGCSAYGNRNFWRIFNDWFGKTQGSLWRTANNGTLYYVDGKRKFILNSIDLISQYGFGPQDIRLTTQQEIDAIPNASSPYTFALGQLVKSDSDSDFDGGTVYFIDRGRKIPLNSMQQFTNFGFLGNNISYLPIEALQRLATSEPISDFLQGPDMTIYQMVQGKKRVLFELSRLKELNPTGKITTMADSSLRYWLFGNPQVIGSYLILGPDGTIKLHNENSYFTLNSMDVYSCWGFQDTKLFKISNYNLVGVDKVDKGPLRCISRDQNGDKFIMDNRRKYLVNSYTTNFSDAPSDIINKIPTSPMPKLIKSPKGEISVIENEHKRPLLSMYTFNNLRLNYNDITNVSNGAYNSFKVGPIKLAIGDLVVDKDGTVSVISDENARLNVGSPQIINSYRFSWYPMYRLSSEISQTYNLDGFIKQYIKDETNQLYLVDSGTRYLIDPSLDSQIGVMRNQLQVNNSNLLAKTSIKNMTRFITSNNGGTVYYLSDGVKRPITSWGKLIELGGLGNINTLTNNTLDMYKTGPKI